MPYSRMARLIASSALVASIWQMARAGSADGVNAPSGDAQALTRYRTLHKPPLERRTREAEYKRRPRRLGKEHRGLGARRGVGGKRTAAHPYPSVTLQFRQ